MSAVNFTFKEEINNFRLDDYVPYMGWIRSEPSDIKIYRHEESNDYYLHDEILNRLFAFTYDSEERFTKKWQFEAAIAAYHFTHPQINIIKDN